MSDSQVYEDIGSHARPSAYDDCKHVKCEVCKAPVGKQCINPVTRKTRKAPCIGRIVRSAACIGRKER